jgi:hypothetical protein
LIVGALRGRDLLTGGAFGPENSILAVVICLAAALFILWRTVTTRKAGDSGPNKDRRGAAQELELP